MGEKDFVRDHIDRCLEVYSERDTPGDVPRDVYEMMRGDLMIAIGMLMALAPKKATP